jgi:hypothetical protein
MRTALSCRGRNSLIAIVVSTPRATFCRHRLEASILGFATRQGGFSASLTQQRKAVRNPRRCGNEKATKRIRRDVGWVVVAMLRGVKAAFAGALPPERKASA